jgi:hypothetical protein
LKGNIMRRASIALLLIATLGISALGGCDSGNIVTGGKDEKVTAVPMGDIDSLEGTISDEMINTDESTDEAPLDKSAPPADPAAKKKDEAKTAKTETAKPEAKPSVVPEPATPAETGE